MKEKGSFKGLERAWDNLFQKESESLITQQERVRIRMELNEKIRLMVVAFVVGFLLGLFF